MKIDWKRKLTSRKFWAAVTGFVTPLLLAFGVADTAVTQVTGIIMAGGTFVEIVGTATGENRREIWMDTTITQEDGETEDDCKARAIAYATMELGKRIRRQSFSVAIDSSELGTTYNIGDIASCVSVRFGVSFSARITGAKYSMDSNSTTTSIILGEPILTALGEYKLNG